MEPETSLPRPPPDKHLRSLPQPDQRLMKRMGGEVFFPFPWARSASESSPERWSAVE